MFDAAVKGIETETLPFPYNKSTYCRYEPIVKSIDHARVLRGLEVLADSGDLAVTQEHIGVLKRALRDGEHGGVADQGLGLGVRGQSEKTDECDSVQIHFRSPF